MPSEAMNRPIEPDKQKDSIELPDLDGLRAMEEEIKNLETKLKNTRNQVQKARQKERRTKIQDTELTKKDWFKMINMICDEYFCDVLISQLEARRRIILGTKQEKDRYTSESPRA